MSTRCRLNPAWRGSSRDGKVRVGMLYNEPPFGEYNIRGEETGFDADLARAMAEAWGVQVEFQQVTRQTGIDMVTSGDDRSADRRAAAHARS